MISLVTRIHRNCLTSTLHKLSKKQFASVTKCDVITIGSGIAGSSCSYRLAHLHNLNVVCLEKESMPGSHATGKSFGIFAESNANSIESKLLTAASRPFLENPDPECFDNEIGDHYEGILNKTGLLAISSPAEYPSLNNVFEGAENTETYSIDEAMNLIPFLKKSAVADHAIYEPNACNFNTRLAYEHFLIGGYNTGVQYVFDHSAMEINKQNNGNWEVVCYNEETKSMNRFEAGLVLNCSGQWADEIAITAGIKPIGLVTEQRSIVVFTFKDGDTDTNDDDDTKSQTPWLRWISPHAGYEIFHSCFQGGNGVFLYDELIGDHGDRDELEIVLDQISKYTTLKVEKVGSKSAGIKCSTKYDKNIVIGPTEEDPSFVWCAALGNYGIQTAPAYSEITSYLALNKQLPQKYMDLGIDVNKLTQSRMLK